MDDELLTSHLTANLKFIFGKTADIVITYDAHFAKEDYEGLVVFLLVNEQPWTGFVEKGTVHLTPNADEEAVEINIALAK